MMKKRNKIIVVLLALIMCVVGSNSIRASEYGDYDITKYNINMVVNEDNTMNINEGIDTYFNVDKHGIIRKIPLKNSVKRLDGTSHNNRAKIENISVNKPYTTSNESGYKVIKIGDPNDTVDGANHYDINYVYKLGKDNSSKYDELYFNLIGTQWDTTISNMSFSIQMPKSFDESKIGFSVGEEGETSNNGITYRVEDNIIKGNYSGNLLPGQAVTIRIELPEGYFKVANSNFDIINVLMLGLPIVFIIISIILWLKFGKDNKVIETVEFNPPEDYDSAEVAFLYKGWATTKDIVSLIIYLANKGYIKVEETNEKCLFSSSKSFKLKKIKEYDGNKDIERIFFDSLFSNRDEVGPSNLGTKFQRTILDISASLNSKENKNTIFEKRSLSKTIIFMIMIITTFLLITVRPILEFSEPSMLIFALMFPGIGFLVLFAGIAGKIPTMGKIFALLWGGMFAGIGIFISLLPALCQDSFYLIAYITGIISIYFMLQVGAFMPRRSKFGNEMLGKIGGFRNFLITAEKDRIEMLVMQDPTYFYHILPYTYVLDISKKWIEKFETIVTQPPDWYTGNDSFSYTSFNSFINTTMTTATTITTPSSSSSSSSSGGGSSGGGSGGGGGSSW